MTDLPADQHRQRSDLFGREFVSLTGAQLLSLVGDQIARVALSVLVYRRTNSPLLTALSYLATFAPALLGAPLLAGLGDRVSRRRVLVGADIYRAALVACTALPHVPLIVLVILLGFAGLAEGPFDAALSALLPDLLPDEQAYVHGLAVRRTVIQGSQVLGFALGGLVLTGLSPRFALLVDASSFIVSAVWLGTGLAYRPAAVQDEPAAVGRARAGQVRKDLVVAWRAIGVPAGLAQLVVIVWLVVLIAITPEGVAAPYARHLHGGGAVVGLLLAASPVGNVLASVVLARSSAARRARSLSPLALLSTAALLLLWLDPPLPVALAALVLSGIGVACNLPAQTAFVAAIPAHERGRAFAIVGTGMVIAQGLGVAMAGALAGAIGVPHAIALSASAGTLLIAGLVAARSRSVRA